MNKIFSDLPCYWHFSMICWDKQLIHSNENSSAGAVALNTLYICLIHTRIVLEINLYGHIQCKQTLSSVLDKCELILCFISVQKKKKTLESQQHRLSSVKIRGFIRSFFIFSVSLWSVFKKEYIYISIPGGNHSINSASNT